MADKKISALTGATTPLAGTEVLPIVQSGATVKVAVSDLTAGRAVSATQLTSTVAIGTAPLVVTSTTNVANLNASSLNGATFAAPGAIGGGTAAAGSFITLSATGNISSSAGNFVVANGYGIDFSAVSGSAAGATGSILKDYEEGTWTPSIGGSATYSNQSGNYIKVGGQVTVTGYLNIASIGSGSTGVISGNPFVAASNSPGSIGYFGNPVTNSIWQTVSADAGGTTFSVFWLAAAGSAPNNASGWFKTGTLTYFSCTYLT